MTYAMKQWSTPEQFAFIRAQMAGQTAEDVEVMAQHLKHAYQLGSLNDCRKLVQAAIASK